MQLLASVHDVVPETLPLAERIVDRLEGAGHGPVLLLVVPGRAWGAPDLARLANLAQRGHPLAGHGWCHAISGYRNAYHRIHSALISRNAAEHLSLAPQEIVQLIRDCRQWFEDRDLPAPQTYVPPAWAMGPVPRRQLSGLGFRYFEYMTGIYDSEDQRMRRLPLLGFEADTAVRALALHCSNAINSWLARGVGRARLAIHPYDEELLLASSLTRYFAY